MLSVLALILSFWAANPPANPPSAATIVTSAEMAKSLKGAPPVAVPGTTDQTVRAVDAGSSRIGVAIVHRVIAEGSAAIVHDKVTEVYHVTAGGGTIVTGGTFTKTGPLVSANLGPSARGTATGGQSRHVTVGDVVVIPPGVAHGFSTIDGSITYTVIRIDPNRLTALK